MLEATEQPLLLTYVMVVVPKDNAVTRPVLDTVATAVLLETQELLTLGIPDPLNWLVAFTQSTVLPEMLGFGLTVRLKFATHPTLLV